MPPLVMGLILDKARQKSPWFVKPVLNKFNSSIHQIILDKNVMNALKMLEIALADKLYLTGQFSAADIQMYLAVYGTRLRGLIPQTHTNTCMLGLALVKVAKVSNPLFLWRVHLYN